MISNILSFLTHRTPSIAKVLVNFISKYRGEGIKIMYTENLWLHKTKLFDYFDFTPKFTLGNKKLKWMMEEVYFKFYTPQEGDVCIDIGAGIGAESIYLSKKIGQSGIVHSIEAAQHTYDVLKKNLATNDCTNVKCHQIAISNKAELVSIDNDISRHIENRVSNQRGRSTIQVKGLTMDGFLKEQGLSKVDYIKVNIEGAEQLLIEAFDSIANVKCVAISCHDFLGKRENNDWLFTRTKVHQFLIDNNFEVHSQNTGIDYLDDWLYGINKN